METTYYWTLFGILVFLLCVFCIYLVLNFTKDYCFPKNTSVLRSENGQKREMVRYNFNRSDVEDLTKIEGDLRTVVPRLSFRNEVDATKAQLLLNSESRDNHIIVETDNIEDNVIEVTEYDKDNIADDSNKQNKTDFAEANNNLENWNPMSIEVLKTINVIEIRARKIMDEKERFTGHLNDLKYYEINETFIRLQIDLSDIYCDKKELRQRKIEVFEYIRKCQQKLKRYHNEKH